MATIWNCSKYLKRLNLKLSSVFPLKNNSDYTKEVFQIISFEPIRGRLTWNSFHKVSVKLVKMDMIQWRIQDFPHGGRQSPRWGRQPIIWPNVSQKLLENERNWTREGSLTGCPLRSANVIGTFLAVNDQGIILHNLNRSGVHFTSNFSYKRDFYFGYEVEFLPVWDIYDIRWKDCFISHLQRRKCLLLVKKWRIMV